MLLYPTRLDSNRTGNGYLTYYAQHRVFHPGVDFNWGPSANADRGQPVFSPTWGIVEFVSPVGTNGGLGNYLVIDHPGLGVWTRYLHLDRIVVRRGDRIAPGQPIGMLGDSGTTSSHLHFEVLNQIGLDFIRRWHRPYGRYPVGLRKDEVASMFLDPIRWIEQSEHSRLEWPKSRIGWAMLLRRALRAARRRGEDNRHAVRNRVLRRIQRLKRR